MSPKQTRIYYKGIWQQPFKAKAIWPDGKIRMVQLSAQGADTYFSIPAHGRYHGIYVSGFVTTSSESGEMEFIPYLREYDNKMNWRYWNFIEGEKLLRGE